MVLARSTVRGGCLVKRKKMRKMLKKLRKQWRKELYRISPAGWYDGNKREHMRLTNCIKELEEIIWYSPDNWS